MLYHFQLGFPETLKIKEQYTFNITYSKHALEAARTDRYGIMKLPERVVIPRTYIVEVETQDNIEVDKIVFRIPYEYDDTLDLCLVIIPNNSLCKTLWLNKVEDLHKSLNKERYTRYEKR